MGKVKCECGRLNPAGTILCESCGRALTEKAKQDKLVDMRYEGSARRSQTYNKTLIDKVWNFFSSVKVGIWIIVLLLVAASFGTILPQEFYIPSNVSAETYYEDVYGTFGKLYYEIGFHDLYNSVWFSALVAALGVSLVIASLDRVVPLYRALKNQRVDRHETFMKKQRLFAQREGNLEPAEWEKIKEALIKKRYNVRTENGALLAEKNRFTRWGPYVNHVGLIIFLLGALLRSVPGMYVDELLWIREGETLQVPGTNGEYYVKNNGFTLQNYKAGEDPEVFNEAINRVGIVAKNYQTDAVLYRNKNNELPGAEPELAKVQEDSIQVNQPMKFGQFAVYQTSFRQDEMKAMHFALTNKETGEEFGEVVIDLFDQQAAYDLGGGYKVELLGYYPDFDGFTKEGEPTSKSPLPNNPAFLFNMITPETPDGEVSFAQIRNTMEPLGETTFKMAFKSLDTRDVSALTIRKDLTLPILAAGGIIFMIGVIQGSYWNHRRLWIREKNGQVYAAGHTNKNWHGLKREIHSVLEGTSVPELEDRQKE